MLRIVQKFTRSVYLPAITAMLVVVSAWTYVHVPFEQSSSACMFCGAVQHSEEKFLRSKVATTWENETSQWVLARHPEHSVHQWVGLSGSRRSGFFDGVMHWDGFTAPVFQIKRMHDEVDQKQAEEFLQRLYQLETLPYEERRSAHAALSKETNQVFVDRYTSRR
jgi:hypothetical protein